MKLRIDTTEKTIELEEQVSYKELKEFLESHFGEGEIDGYEIIPHVQTVNTQPWIQPYSPYYSPPYNPWIQPNSPGTGVPYWDLHPTTQISIGTNSTN